MTNRSGPDRDRDGLGRPRNARPRDALGRPLSRDDLAPPPQEPGYSGLAANDGLDLAQALLDAGRPFEAHEVFEALWKAAPESDRPLWQGLAQLAVAITHTLRGNDAGAERVLSRARANLAGYVGAPAHDVDVAGLLDWAGRVVDGVETDGAVPPLRLRGHLDR